MVDARVGITPSDLVFADILRKRAAHVILAANKAEGVAAESGCTGSLQPRSGRTDSAFR